MSERRTASEWFDLIETWKISGMSGAAWCRENSVAYHCFLYWRRRREQTISDDNALVRREPGMGFTEIIHSGTLTAEVGGVRLHLERGFDPVLFREVIAAVRGA